ncbi:MAG: 3-deoxy-D-manno-octulosonic acid transferase, partial [Armatimonadetes bacterium]|nr:3-deoxy-D-manno-octulosonic acid transferase [Armatimonadota bacterium]
RAVDRAGEIAALVTAAGLHPLLRSALPAEAEESRERGAVVIVDTIGELSELYVVATVAFVGRSLVKLGGSNVLQNVLQAAAQGKPTLSGPYVNNVRDSVALLAGAGVLSTVTDAASLAREVLRLFGDAPVRAAVEAAARAVVEANRGATARTADALLELLDE